VIDEAAGPRVPPLPFFGFAVASIGGPLAIAAIYFTGAAGRAISSAGLVAVVGGLLAGFPLLVWLRYSEDIVSAGGLAAFVEAAAGRRLALAQAAVWAFSYFLYLPYTVTDVVYEMLVVVFPGLRPWRGVLEVLLPVGIVALVLAGLTRVLWTLLASAAAQLVVMLALGYVMLAHHNAARSSFTHVSAGHPLARGSANVALLFVCGSLPLFLGAEAVGGRSTVRRSLAGAWALVAVYLAFTVFPLAHVPAVLRNAPIPGYAIASAYSGRPLAVAVGLGAAISVCGVIVAEYLALSRLLHFAIGVPVRRLLWWIGVPFVALDVVSLANPDWFDHQLLRPSLTALFISQLIVFVVFPGYRARRGKLGPVDIGVAAVAFALMSWGLYRALAYPVST
jgi:amino acid transporter